MVDEAFDGVAIDTELLGAGERGRRLGGGGLVDLDKGVARLVLFDGEVVAEIVVFVDAAGDCCGGVEEIGGIGGTWGVLERIWPW